uniref:PX domain-containing protein n=1 Tax=Plectus sambesii TaxID=2011161 RepID=A0A914V1V8_9BILA
GVGSHSTEKSSHRPLVNIWLPTAFLTGKGADVHHVYQVYIRIANEEWNVYRRYSDFLKLHQLLCKQDSAVSAFKFPPKKKVGKKVWLL